jgi:hypothetical protein
VVVHHGVLGGGSACESFRVMMSQWLGIMVCYVEPVVDNTGEICCTSGCESWCAMMS